MRLDVKPLVFDQAMDDIAAYWERGPHRMWEGKPFLPLAGSAEDQLVPDGVDNPYWELLRHMPWVDDLPWRGRTVYGFADQVGIDRGAFTTTYAWSIPSPGDIAWIAGLLDGRAVVELDSLWPGAPIPAWPAAVAGQPFERPPVRGDASAAGEHPDRALFMSWPNYSEPWAAHALAAYQGDLFIYVGEGEGGCCADDDFFNLLRAEWSEVGDSPHHHSWYGINCWLTAYRRTTPGGAA
jgi:hypothetical protein